MVSGKPITITGIFSMLEKFEEHKQIKEIGYKALYFITTICYKKLCVKN